MNEEEKTLEIARLMGWVIERRVDQDEYHIVEGSGEELKPYEDCIIGIYQFAKVLLKFPQVVDNFHTETKAGGMTSAFYQGWWHDLQPTQKTILDEILILNGVRI